MREDRSRGWLRTGVAAALSGLVLGTMVGPPVAASPDDELVVGGRARSRPCADGDTLMANLDRRLRGDGAPAGPDHRRAGPRGRPQRDPGGVRRRRRPRSGSRRSSPSGPRVQTRVVDVRFERRLPGGRIVRSLYAQDEEGNWYRHRSRGPSARAG